MTPPIESPFSDLSPFSKLTRWMNVRREARRARSDIDGLSIVRDADLAEGGEDDFTNFEARKVSDQDLEDLGYSDMGPEGAKARPDED